MAEESKDLNATVDELSKPENKSELDKTLTDAFKQATNSPEAKTDDSSNEDKTNAGNEGEDLSKNAGENDKGKNRFETLLEDRNKAREAAADSQTQIQTLTKQVEDLKNLITKSSENGGDSADGNEGTDEPMTKKEIDAYLEKKLQEKDAASNQSLAAEKSINDQILALETNKETPKAKDYSNELKAIMAKHTTLSAYAAYRMLQGEGVIPMDGVNRSNANRTGTGNRSRTNLLSDKKPEDMTTAEMTQYLKGAEKTGDLKGLI